MVCLGGGLGPRWLPCCPWVPSRAIPLHLLTREAMAIYIKHLKPGGVIIFQATNRYVNIAPVVAKLAAERPALELAGA